MTDTPSETSSIQTTPEAPDGSAGSTGYWLVNMVNFGDGIAYFGVLALLTLFINHEVGFGTNWTTVGVSVFTGLVTLFMLGAGSLTDWLGSRRALTLSMTVILAGRLILVASPSAGPEMLVGSLAWVSLVIMGIGEGALQPALYAGVKDYTKPGKTTMGYAWLYAIMNLGIVAGQFISPIIRSWYAETFENRSVEDVQHAGITGAFWFFTAVTALVVIANVVFFTRRVELRESLRAREKTKKQQEDRPRTLGEWMRSLPFLDARFIFFIFILYPVRTLFAHQYLTMPHYVTRVFPAEVGAKWEWLNGINPAIIVIFVPLFAALTLRKRVVDMMIVGTLVSALATFLLVFEPSLPLLIAYFVLFTLGEALWSSRFLEYVADLAPPNRVGIYMGIAGVPWFLAKFLTGFYAGWVVEHFVPEVGSQDPSTMWFIYGIVAMITPVGLVLARRWLLSKEKAEPAKA